MARSSAVVAEIDPSAAITPQLAEAFAKFEEQRARVGALRFVADRAIPRELVPLLERYLPKVPELNELTLIHPSAAAGFIASTLALRYPRVRFLTATQP